MLQYNKAEIFTTDEDGHKFKKGERVRLTGLEDNPEFNGRVIRLTNYRMDSEYGKAYYFDSTGAEDIHEHLNWVYEHRLEAINDDDTGV